MQTLRRTGCRCLVTALLAATPAVHADGPSYTIVDLGPVVPGAGSTSTADGINSHGQVAGGSTSGNVWASTLWLPGPAFGLPAGPNDIGPRTPYSDRAYGLNDLGQTVGFMRMPNGANHAYRWDPVGGLLDLGTLGGGSSIAKAVNNSGVVVGESEVADPDIFKRAFVWDGEEMIDLGSFHPDAFQSRAEDINELGQVAGYGMYLDDPDAPDDSRLRAFLWLPEPAYGLDAGLHDIDDRSTEPFQISTARGLNDLGQVVCWGTNILGNGTSTSLPFWLWLPEPDYGLPAGMNDLGGVYGGIGTTFAQDINNRGEVVFRANVDPAAPFGDFRAIVWRQGEWFDLIDCIPPADQAEWWFGSATDINDAGQITGWGGRNGESHAFLLTPVYKELNCPADLSANGTVDSDDLLEVLGHWGMCPAPGAPCPGDVDGDEAVDVADLIAVLEGWGACPGTEQGACCFAITGDCQDLNEVDCIFLGGTWQPGTCDTASCPEPPTGACCLYPSGLCIEVTEFECANVHHGTWQGPRTICAETSCTVPAVGDRLEHPFTIDALPFSDIGFTTDFGDDYDVACEWTAIAPDVVYAWTPEADDVIRISLCGDTDYDSKIYVWENDRDTTVACNDDWCTTPSFPDAPLVSQIDVLAVTAGNTYYIVIDGWGVESGKYTLAVGHVDLGACCLPNGDCEVLPEDTCLAREGEWQGAGTTCGADTCAPPPTGACCLGVSCLPDFNEWDCEQVFGGTWLGAGSDCAGSPCTLPPGDRIDDPLVIGGLPYGTTGDTSGFLDWHDEACPAPSSAPEVVYAYTPAADETVTVSLCGNSAFDTKLYVYEDAETPGAPFACNEDACTTPSFPNFPFVSELAGLQLTAGRTYFIVVDGFGDWAGFYTLDITLD
jgi:probable HAF family extracellular repeat protein